MKTCVSIILVLLQCSLESRAQLAITTPLQDHMILQQGKPVCITGTAAPYSMVSAEMMGKVFTCMVSAEGNWTLCLPPLPVIREPFELRFRNGVDSAVFCDLLSGDLWICIGQSNMEWPVQKDALSAQIPGFQPDDQFRWYNPVYAGKGIFGSPFSDSVRKLLRNGIFYSGSWEKANMQSIPAMSAVAFYFGRKLREQTGVPVGLLQLSIGGAPLETFIRREALLADSVFRSKTTGNWLYNDQLPVWVRERGLQNLVSTQVHDDTTGFTEAHPFKPAYAFENGLKPFTGLPAAGFLCYQGESNAQEPERVAEYGRLQELMVADYRSIWKDSTLFYFFVQIASIDSTHYKSQLWPEFRYQQYLSYKQMNRAGMAVSSDHGAKNDVHPREKKEIGERLARWALKDYYGFSIKAEGPEPVKAVYRKGIVVIFFERKGDPLQVKHKVTGFRIDGKEVHQLTIRKHQIRLHWPEKPQILSYGWDPYTTADLCNIAGLPCSTFRLKID